MEEGNDKRNRTLVIGLDGATFEILNPLVDSGFMPNLKKLMADGVSGPLESVYPTNSPAAWSSFSTGKLPSQHGIFEFRYRQNGNPYPVGIVNSTYLHDESIWQILSRHDLSSGVISVPMTFPPQSLNGFMVTGLLTPKSASVFTYPEHFSNELRNIQGGEYHFDVRWMNYEGQEEELIKALNQLAKINLETTLHMANSNNWDFLITVFVSPDRLQHCLWPYIDPNYPKYDSEKADKIYPLVQQHFSYLDSCLGKILEKLEDDQTTVMVMSDHGFTGVYQQMVINDWLAEQGLLKYRTARKNVVKNIKKVAKKIIRHPGIKLKVISHFPSLTQEADIDWSKTKAYCPWDQQQGISINLRGRERQGIVSTGAEYEQLLLEIESLLSSAKDYQTKLPLFPQVIRAKDYYDNDPITEFTPDIIVIPGSYMRVAAPRQLQMYDSTGWATGDHAPHGIFIAKGDNINRGEKIENSRLIDLTPTILYTLNIPIPSDMKGCVLESIFNPGYFQTCPPDVESVGEQKHNITVGKIFNNNEKELEDRLRGLGYL